jgi:deazaflavin-dependent oxidoreductase (nitroreductase family)
VFYLRDGEAVVICNVRPEYERTNPWVINLRSHPVAQLQIGGETAHYQAREATENEIKRLWPRLIELWPAFQAHYEGGGVRSIFVLERA